MIPNKKQNHKDKPLYSTWHNVKYICRGAIQFDRYIFVYFILFTLSTAIAPFIGILFPRYILSELINEKRFEVLMFLMIGFFFLSSIFAYGAAYLTQVMVPRMVVIRFQFMKLHHDKCMTTDYCNTENPEYLNEKETAYRCLQNNHNGIEGVLYKICALAGGMLALIGYIAIISTLNQYVLWYLFLNVVISYYLTFRVRHYEHNKKDEISRNDRRSGYTYDLMYNFSYGKEIRMFGLTDWIANRFAKYKSMRLDTHKEIKWKYFHVSLMDAFLLIIREGVIYAYLIYMVLNNRMNIPDFMMYFATIASFAGWFNNLINDLAHIRAQNLDICDFRKFIEQPDTVQKQKNLPIPEGPYEFEFRNVSFHYPNSENYIYKNLNLVIPYGQKLAIVGHNGAGKTTFIKLLCRLYDVTEGEILLNGINIKNFSKTEYYKLFSSVFQEVKILAFSVAENIALEEKENIDQIKLMHAIEKAGILDKVSSLKRGVDTSLLKILDEDGIELSGGENQKISIARALYKDGPIMLLDEPTAALDAIAEYQTYLNFNDMVKDKTAIYISHRLASTLFCDQIAMFEQGEIVEYGTHAHLLEKGGKYADMFATQAKYYKEEEAVSA